MHLKSYTESFYIDIIFKENKIGEHIQNTLTVTYEKSKMVSFASLVMKNIVVPATLDLYQVLVAYLNVLPSSFNSLW